MELLIIDQTEAVSANVTGPTLSVFMPELDTTSTSDATRTVGGTLSPIALRPTRFTNAAGDSGFNLESYQETGKVVYGTAFANDYAATASAYVLAPIIALTEDSGITPLSVTWGTPVVTVGFLGYSEEVDPTPNTWSYLELVIDLDDSVFEVYRNNSLLFSGPHSFTKVRHGFRFGKLSGNSNQTEFRIDDFYHLGGTTGPYTDRLGPVRAVRAPLLNAAATAFTPQGAPSNLAAVDKTSRATGTYNRSPASNDVSDRFRIDTSVIPEDKDILGVSHRIYYRKSDIGPRNLDAVITGPAGANKINKPLPERLVAFGGHDPMILTQAPGGGVLDIEALEDMEFGYEVKA